MPRAQRDDIRILIVDDSAVFREALCTFIAELDGMIVVASVGSGEEGLALVGRLRPNVVLLDVRMMGLDGFETTRRLKQLPAPPAVVVITTSEDDGFREAAMAVGADAFVLKRRAGADIEQVIHRVARQRRGRAAPPVTAA